MATNLTTTQISEQEIDYELMKIIGVSKGMMVVFNDELRDLYDNAYLKSPVQQFYDLKSKLVELLNYMESEVIIPMQQLLLQNFTSSYRFTMMELLDRFDVSYYRQGINEIEQGGDGMEFQTRYLWRLCYRAEKEANRMLQIADYRMNEVVSDKILEGCERKTTSPKIDFSEEEIKGINNQLQELINKCLEVSREVLGVFFSTTKSQEEYAKLLTVSQKLVKIIPIIRSCIK